MGVFRQTETCVARCNFFKEFEAASRRKFLLRKKFPGVEGAEPSSPSAEDENPIRRFLFAKLFLCAYMLKEKADERFCAIFI